MPCLLKKLFQAKLLWRGYCKCNTTQSACSLHIQQFGVDFILVLVICTTL